MTLNPSDLTSQLLDAVKSSLGDSWGKAQNIVGPQLEELARIGKSLGDRALAGEISTAEAKALFNIQVNTARTVMLTVEGLGILAVEGAINAVIDVFRQTANTALGFDLV